MAYTGVTTIGNVRALPQALMNLYSKRIEFEAMHAMHFISFADIVPDFSKQKGETIIFTVYRNVQRGGKLVEGVRLTERTMQAYQVPLSIDEYGNAIGVTEKMLKMSDEDLLATAAFLLGRDYTLVTDLMLRDACAQAPNVFYGNQTDTLPNMDADCVYSTAEVDLGVELLQTNSVPKFKVGGDEFYVAIAHPHQIKDLKHDPEWKYPNQYTGAIFAGEVGKWNGVRFIENANVPNGACAATDPAYDADLHLACDNASLDAYSSYLFGQGAYGFAVGAPVELRMKAPEDYGREQGMAWIAIQGAGLLNDNNIVRIETT